MNPATAMPCQLQYVSGYRKGQPCPYRASEIVNLAYSPGPFLVCGYHARAYGSGVRYPLHWNLAWIRKMQLDFRLPFRLPPPPREVGLTSGTHVVPCRDRLRYRLDGGYAGTALDALLRRSSP